MNLSDLSKHLTPPGGEAFNVTPDEAASFFRGKGLRPTFSYADMLGEEHRTAFTIAKMMETDMLADVQESLNKAIDSGTAFKTWADDIEGFLQQRGWWGRQQMIDPLTGSIIEARLGSPARLELIFRTNLQSAYAAGQWDMIEDQAAEAPYLLYDAIDDGRTRPEHASWDGTVLRVTDNWWKSHTPPCGYNCRCSVIQLDKDDLEDLGIDQTEAPPIRYRDWRNPRTGKIERVPVGVDPGFGRAAASRVERLQRLQVEKVAALPDDQKPAAIAGIAATQQAIEAAVQAPRKLTKKQRQQMLVERAERDLAEVFLPTGGYDIDAMTEALDAIEEVNHRFSMGKLAFIGDPLKGERKYRMSRRALGGYAERTDALLFRTNVVNPEKMREVAENDDGYSQLARNSWQSFADFMRRRGQEVTAVIAESLPGGRPFGISNSTKGVMYHEMGHRVHAMNKAAINAIITPLRNPDNWGWRQLVSEYGSTVLDEYVAEAFSLYMTGTREDWRRIYPPMLQWFKANDRRQK